MSDLENVSTGLWGSLIVLRVPAILSHSCSSTFTLNHRLATRSCQANLRHSGAVWCTNAEVPCNFCVT